MDRPIVSVVTPTYKKFDCIYSTIDSVLEQTYPRIEYIIADDGSGDFPRDEIESYIYSNKKSNIVSVKIIVSPMNRGTVKNINNAYQNAVGDIIIPLSGDDEFYSNNVIDKVVEAFQRKKCEVLVTSRMACKEDGTEVRRIPSKKQEKLINRLDTAQKQHLAFITDEFYEMASGSAMYVRKSFIDKWGYFDENYTLWEDGPFLTQYTRSSMVSTEYDLISIKYRLGGVSNGKPHPLMRRDRELYNRQDRIYELPELSRLQKRKVEYICKRYNTTSSIKKYLLYITYLDVMFEKVIYKLRQE